MTTDEAVKVVFTIYARMDRGQRVQLIKLLKASRSELDMKYPLGLNDKPSDQLEGLMVQNELVPDPIAIPKVQ